MVRSVGMNEDFDTDEESEWFEPVGPSSSMAGGNFMSELMLPEKRVFVLMGLISLTLIGGIGTGAFDAQQTHGEEERASASAASPHMGSIGAPPINASKALRKHLDAQGEQVNSSNATDATEQVKKPADKVPSKAEEKDVQVDDTPAPVANFIPEKPIVIDFDEVMELGNEALANKEWKEAAEYLEQASSAWKKKRRGKSWRTLRYDLAKAHYKDKKPLRSVEILETLRESDPKWDKPLLLLGLAAKDAQIHPKAVKYLSLYLEKGGTKTAKVCPYLEEQDAVDNGSADVQDACEDE